MAQSTTRPPQLVAPRSRAPTLEATRRGAGQVWDADVWHVMDARDNALIEDEILRGAGSSKFVYKFDVAGQEVSGISVIGARHLAAAYGGIKHRIVASTHKIGALFTFTTYPAKDSEMRVSCSIIPDLAEEPDFYSVVVEVSDIKTGNSIQVEVREKRFERRRNGTEYERPHYAVIAQSKGFRNGVLNIIKQDIQISWKIDMLKLAENSEIITASVIDEKRENVLRFAMSKSIPLDRRLVSALSFEQLSGLGDAAREGQVPAFAAALQAAGLVVGSDHVEGDMQSTELASASQAGSVSADKPDQKAATTADETEHDAETGEVHEQGDSQAGATVAEEGAKDTAPVEGQKAAAPVGAEPKPAPGKGPREGLF